MNEQERMPNKVPGPIEVRYRRDIPDVTVERIEEHYYVKAGCKTAIFHKPEEVRCFLVELLVLWIQDNLGDNRIKMAADVEERMNMTERPASVRRL